MSASADSKKQPVIDRESPLKHSPTTLSDYSNLHCACGQLFGPGKAAEAHIESCELFKDRFGELLTALMNTAKKITCRNDYNVIKYLFHLQKYHIRLRIKGAGFCWFYSF